METIHVPVMPEEVIQWLDPRPGQTFVDGTLGGGGHTALLAEAVGDGGRIIALDRDLIAVQRAERLLPSPPVIPLHASYHRIDRVLERLDFSGVDGILLDLGLSSDQLNDVTRGFSFQTDGPLDLRFDVGREIADVIYRYGEERFSRRIARKIVQLRDQKNPVRSSRELADVVRRCVPRSKNHNIDPATRTFQALRIAVNDELQILEQTIRMAPSWLVEGGRLVVISFHSLEDRIVKHGLRSDPHFEILTKKPAVATEAEIERNSRSRSAKMRVAVCRRPLYESAGRDG